jgi:rhodanese-related sulfurtransferase
MPRRSVLFSALVALLFVPAASSPPVWAQPPPMALLTHGQLLQRIAVGLDDMLLLDVRTPEEFAAGHLPGAVNIPHDQLMSRLADLPADKNREIAVYCRTGRRSDIALTILKDLGYSRLLHVEGDFLGWQAAGHPLVTETPAAANP